MDDFQPLPFDVVAAAIAAGRLLQRHVDRAMGYQGLTWEQLLTLSAVHDARGLIHGGAIARRLDLNRQTVSRYLHRFEDRGLVRWRIEPWIHSVRLTDDGARVLQEAMESLADVFAAIRRVDVDEQRSIVTAPQHIRRELRRPRHQPSWLERYRQPQLWDE
jgi:DNA-binding MarR family transcriptional regulator